MMRWIAFFWESDPDARKWRVSEALKDAVPIFAADISAGVKAISPDTSSGPPLAASCSNAPSIPTIEA